MTVHDDSSIEQVMQEFQTALQKKGQVDQVAPELQTQAIFWSDLREELLWLMDEFRSFHNKHYQARIEPTGDGVNTVGVVMYAFRNRSFPKGGTLRFSSTPAPDHVLVEVVFLDQVVDAETYYVMAMDQRMATRWIKRLVEEFNARAQG
ncbi:hypothetical protein [Dyella flagellata]|uniref:Uncharacterized protein n=1 Tax=Dyella flagellata TaxID=1867833 RepID=A0ABQ5XF20_9GAMM|nr:hypothetical protein [Dyella flagellata]GLQ90243.1 hypothetical protein GCM10007898_38180 [Dyella flagellata]